MSLSLPRHGPGDSVHNRAEVDEELDGVKPEGVEVKAQAFVTVERAGIFGVSFDLPTALEVTDVAVTGAEMDDWTRVVEGGGAVLRVAFRDRLLGQASIVVTGRMPLALPEEEKKPTPFDVPLVKIRGAQHVRGYVMLHSDSAIDRRETDRPRAHHLNAGTDSPEEDISGEVFVLAARKAVGAADRQPEAAFGLNRRPTELPQVQHGWLEAPVVGPESFLGVAGRQIRLHLPDERVAIVAAQPDLRAGPEIADAGLIVERAARSRNE